MKGSLRRKRRASEITDFEEKPIQNSRPSQTESDSLHSSDQRPVDEGQHASFADEFLNEYAFITLYVISARRHYKANKLFNN